MKHCEARRRSSSVLAREGDKLEEMVVRSAKRAVEVYGTTEQQGPTKFRPALNRGSVRRSRSTGMPHMRIYFPYMQLAGERQDRLRGPH